MAERADARWDGSSEPPARWRSLLDRALLGRSSPSDLDYDGRFQRPSAPYPPARPYDRTPQVTASTNGLALDFLENREYGGLVIDWGKGPHASRYEVQISDDGSEWKTVRTVEGSDGGKDWFFLPETESRHLRLQFLEGTGKPAIDVKPLEWAPTPDTFFAEKAGGC